MDTWKSIWKLACPRRNAGKKVPVQRGVRIFFKRGYLDFEQNLQQKVFFSDSRANKEPFTNIRFGLLFSRQHRAVALHHQDWKADMKNAGKKAESLVRHFLFTHGSQQ